MEGAGAGVAPVAGAVCRLEVGLLEPGHPTKLFLEIERLLIEAVLRVGCPIRDAPRGYWRVDVAQARHGRHGPLSRARSHCVTPHSTAYICARNANPPDSSTGTATGSRLTAVDCRRGRLERRAVEAAGPACCQRCGGHGEVQSPRASSQAPLLLLVSGRWWSKGDGPARRIHARWERQARVMETAELADSGASFSLSNCTNHTARQLCFYFWEKLAPNPPSTSSSPPPARLCLPPLLLRISTHKQQLRRSWTG